MPVFRLERLTHAAVAVLRAVATVAGRRSAPVLVGGAVRDAWLERRPGRGAVDLDVAGPAGARHPARRRAGRPRGGVVAPRAPRGAGARGRPRLGPGAPRLPRARARPGPPGP